MAERFLFNTKVLPDALLDSPDGTGKVIEDFARLRSVLDERVSDAARDLFAEPLLSQTSGAGYIVSWYVPRDGEVRALHSLATQARRTAEGLLSAQLSELEPLRTDPEIGSLLDAALSLRSREDIWVVDGAPVLVNWGILPPEIAKNPIARSAHLAATLGPYTGFKAESDTVGGAVAIPSPPLMQDRSTEPAAPLSGRMPDTQMRFQMSQAPEPRNGLPLAAWLPPVILLGVFSLILLWLLLPGTRLFPQPSLRLADEGATLAVLEEGNRALAERVRELNDGLANAVCTAEGDLILPSHGRMPDGFLPPAAAQTAAPEEARLAPSSLLPPDPQQIAVPQDRPERRADGPPVSRQETTDLLSLIESQTALVLVEGRTVSGTGSGFFVAPDLLLTNFHVIEPVLEGGGDIFVTSESIGDVLRGEIVAFDGPLEASGRDFALLRIEDAVQPFYTLRSSDETMRLQNVIAAGYPGALLETDNSFAGLLSGQAGAIPSVTVTDGIVNVEQDFGPQAMRVVVHTATISPGNSGGPLVDYCGRVVGINTFGRSAESRQLNFALTSTDLLRFLDEAGAAASANGSACAPVPIGTSVDASAADDAAGAPVDTDLDAGDAPATDAPAQ